MMIDDELMTITTTMLPAKSIGILIHQCSITKAFRHGISLHASVIKLGFQSDLLLSNHLLNMYAKCGHIPLARNLFDQMSHWNLVSWSALISGYHQAGESLMAIKLFSQLDKFHVPNEFVFASAITACANTLALIQGQQFHAKAIKLGFDSVSFVSNSLISMYMKCTSCDDALLLHDGVLELNRVSYNVLVSGFVEKKEFYKAFHVFKSMCRHGFVPDRFTFVAVMDISMSTDNAQLGKALHCQIIKLNLDSTVFLGNVILTMYSRFNFIEDANRVFRWIEEKDVISWNTLIAACSHCDDHLRGLNVFRELTKETSLEVDDFTFTTLLSSCAGLACIRHGKEIHSRLVRTRRYRDVGVGNALVNMYAKCGCIGYAYAIFNRMIDRNLVSWNTIIAGFGNHGLGTRAVELFEQMKAMEVKPDSVTFTALLAACNHSGLVDIGKCYFNSMEETYGIQPNIEHFSCLIDILGRAGRLDEAIEEYKMKLSNGYEPIVLGSLLSSSRLHGDVVMGEGLAKEILKFTPVTTSPFVLLSNLYASDGMWKSVGHARKLLKGSGLVKEPGHSLIEVKGAFEKFTVGDFSHSMMAGIRDMLETLNWAAGEVVPC